MKTLLRASRLLITSGLLLLAIWGIATHLNRPSQPAARAETLHVQSAGQILSAGQIVEVWTGTILIDTVQNERETACPAAWVCPGYSHHLEKQEWHLEVLGDGTVDGIVKNTILSYSYQQSETIQCGGVGGGGQEKGERPVYGCTFTPQVIQPLGIIHVQGKRKLDKFSHQPILEITQMSQIQPCQCLWIARGFDRYTGAPVIKSATSDCDYYIPEPREIVTYDNGRPPQILMDGFFDAGSFKITQVGHLTASTEAPLLKLDRELLDRSIFLDQVSVQEKYDAKLNWNSPNGGWVSWKLGNAATERVGPTDKDDIPKPFDDGMQGVGRKELTAQAKTTLNRTSWPETTQIQVAPPPSWVGPPSQISAVKTSGAVTYKVSLKFPDPAFEGTVPVPSFVPWFGGKNLGIKKTQGALALKFLSTTEAQGSLSGQTGFEAMGGTVVGSLGGHATVVFNASGVKIPKGGMDFSIAGTIPAKEESLLKVVPAFQSVLNALEKANAGLAQAIGRRAKAKLSLAPKLAFGFNYFTQEDKIKFKNAQVTPSIGFKADSEIAIIEKEVTLGAGIGGAIGATFQVPEPYFKEAFVKGNAQVTIKLYMFTDEVEGSFSVALGGARELAAANAGSVPMWQHSSAGASWQPLPRSYLDRPNYARWHGDDVTIQASTQSDDDQLLVENVFPLANPAVAAWTDDFGFPHVVQVWAHDKPSSPVLSGGEIAISTKFGDGWSEPTFVTDDDREDLAPQVTYLPNGQNIVLWQRMDTATPPDFNSDPTGYLSHWQVAAKNVNSNDPLTQLSTSGSLNHRQHIGITGDGALAIWVNNPGNQLMGDSTHPDTILSAHYTITNSSWSGAAPVLANVAGLVSLDLATNGQHAAIVYALDMNGDLTSTADQELFYLTWNGTNWSAPTRLTNNNVADENPQLVLDANGQPALIWRQGGVLKFLSSGWQNPPVNLPAGAATDNPDYELVRNADGQLALVWQEVGPEDTRVGFTLYDAAHHNWQRMDTLTPPKGYEGSEAHSITATFVPANPNAEDDQGCLLLAYQLAQVELMTKTVDNVAIPNVPVIVQEELRAATLPLNLNLSVTANDLTNPDKGHIQALIHNTGLGSAQNVPVVLSMGPADVESGLTQNLTQTIPLIAAGSTATLTFSIPDSKAAIFSVNIDPQKTLDESDTKDNSATLGTNVAIAMLPSFYSPLGAALRAQITQQGNRYLSVTAPAILTVGTPEGAIVGSSRFDFPITPTSSVTVTAFITPVLLGAGRHQLYWTVDPSETLGETDRSNNIDGTTLMVLPDLAASENSIFFGTAPGVSAPFQIGVENIGNWANAASTLEVYDGLPGEAATHSLLQLPIPAIAPGTTKIISGTLLLSGLPAAATGLSAVVVQLDQANQVDENNENNNLAASGAILERASAAGNLLLYLPWIHP